MQVALVKTGGLGDVVRTTAVAAGLIRTYPHAAITWITSAEAAPLLEGLDFIRKIEVLTASERGHTTDVIFDWVISLDEDRESCRRAASLRARRFSGVFEDGAGDRSYTDDVAPWFGMGLLRPAALGGTIAANNLKRTNPLSHGELLYRCLGLKLPVSRPAIRVPSSSETEAAAALNAAGVPGTVPILGFNSAASPRWQRKTLDEDVAAEIAHGVATELECTVLLLGGPDEEKRNRRIAAASRSPRVLAIAPVTDLRVFAALVRECRVVISVDSLALHVANAVKRPVVALLGPTSAAELDLYGTGRKLITPLACRCCYLNVCSKQPNCSREWRAGDIARSAAELLGTSASVT